MSRNHTAPTEDDVYELLSNRRRRLLLHYLAENEGRAGIEDVTGYIASVEKDRPVEEIPEDARRSVYISLYQVHLPKLADYGVVTYDLDEGAVYLEDPAEELLRHLLSGGRPEPSTELKAILAIAAVGLALSLAAAAGVLPGVGALIGALVSLAVGAIALYRLVGSDSRLPTQTDDGSDGPASER